MFDEYARHLIDSIPALPGLDKNECRRALSRAFFYVVQARLATGYENLDSNDVAQTLLLLRRLADSLESVSVFDPLNGVEVDFQVVSASAFVAAEALVLLSQLSNSEPGQSEEDDPFQSTTNYAAIEAGLLYMIGGYDINAATAVGRIAIPSDELEGASLRTARIANGRYLLDRILALCKGNLESRPNAPFTGTSSAPKVYRDLRMEVRIRCYEALSEAVDQYLVWLAGGDADLTSIIARMKHILAVTASPNYPGFTAFADVHHAAALLLATLDHTSKRSTVHSVPPPEGLDSNALAEFRNYLFHRARGEEGMSGRPFLWPSSTGYIQDCLPGPTKDAVIAMPTGSGKSFVAELGISHALATGNVIYLAPTNALVHQIRRDLQVSLKPFEQTKVLAFVGSEEYTTLSEEQVRPDGERYVAVMTPEKCALALKLNPQVFDDCALCVFDECHLLSDAHRGVTADFLMAQLLLTVPNLRFILMSAMVSNPEELANWLDNWRQNQVVTKVVTWRPSRALRGLLVLEHERTLEAFKKASVQLEAKAKRKNISFDAPLALVAGLSGPWTQEGSADYAVARIPLSYPGLATRKSGEIRQNFDGWKNTSSRILAEKFARCGMPVINFILTSKHHVFSAAAEATVNMAPSGRIAEALPDIVDAWLSIAEAELGVGTVVRSLLSRGVAVHTSVMLQEERLASEWMFTHKRAALMFATGTLAQGLNLPAVVVIVAGTSLGDPRNLNQADKEGGERANSIILNGFGRAGRPGFSSQGVAILVSDTPFQARIGPEIDPRRAIDRYKVLGYKDAALAVHSPIETFLDRMLSNIESFHASNDDELTLTTLLGEFDDQEDHAGQLVRRTFAAFKKKPILTPEVARRIGRRMIALKQDLLRAPHMPQWMNTAAMKAGVDFARAWKMWAAYSKRGVVSVEEAKGMTVNDWVKVFFEIMMQLPPKRVAQYVARDELKTETVLTRMRDLLKPNPDLDDVPWAYSSDWIKCWQDLWRLVRAFMLGKSYSVIAQLYLNKRAEEISIGRSPRDPIPMVFAFIKKVVDRLALDAGCFVAINEFLLSADPDSPSVVEESLSALPLCIRNGCDSLSTLAWFRFGIRQRVCAHALSKLLPVPVEAETDLARAKWVRRTRRKWLDGEIELDESAEPLLAHARKILTFETK